MTVGGRRVLIAFAFVGVSILSNASSSFAAAGQKEYFLNSAGLELLGGANRISLAPGMNYGLYDWLQVGGSIGYQSLGFGDTSVNTLTLSLGPTFDIGPYETADFIFFGLAMRKGSGEVSDPANDPGGMGIAFMVGRRIPLGAGIGYRPSVGLQLAGKTTIVVNAFAVSYLF